MSQFRALLVDDERLARRQLRNQLAHFPEIEVVAEADNASRALQAVRQFEPDLLFLDIQMAGESGFDILEQAGGGFQTIFVTAFDEFAVRAFEVNALDYLLKPVSLNRLAAALRRLSAPLSAAHHRSRVSGPVPLNSSDYLFLKHKSKAHFLRVHDIKYVLADGSYTHVFNNDGRTWALLQPIKHWEERLPRDRFARIHRRCIVNLDFVERIEDGIHPETYEVILRDVRTPLPVSRRYALILKQRFQ
jgi:two-component system LytT family response regulator